MIKGRDYTLLTSSRKLTGAHRADNRASRTHAAEVYGILIDSETTLEIYLAEDQETRDVLGADAGTRKERKAAKAAALANPDDKEITKVWDRMDAAQRVLQRNAVYKTTIGRALCRIRELPTDKPSEGFKEATDAHWATLQSHADAAGNIGRLTDWGLYGGDPAEPNGKPDQGPRNNGTTDADTDAEAVELPAEAADIIEAARTLYGDGCADSVAGILAYWEEKTNRDAEDPTED